MRKPLTLLALLAPSVVHAATLRVGPSRSYDKIQDAIDDASSGDTILVDADTYEEELVIGKDLTIIGSGSGSVVVQRQNELLTIDGATVELTGFSFSDPDERAIEILGGASVTFDDVVIDNVDTSLAGSALRVRGGSVLSMSHSEITDARSNGNDGVVYVSSSTVDFATTVWADDRAENGAAVFVTGTSTVTFSQCSFDTNEADDDGGALYLDAGADVTVNDSTFDANTATRGGAIYTASSTSTTLALSETTFSANSASSGAALYLVGTAVTSEATALDSHASTAVQLGGAGSWLGTDDEATGNGGTGSGGAFGVTDSAELDLVGAVLSDNQAANGGAIHHDSTGALSLTGSQFDRNDATASGGAVFAGTGATVIADSWFTGNGGADGGAVFLDAVADVSLHRNLLCANTAAGTGGGVAANGTGGSAFAWTHNVFAENAATSEGGGAWIGNGTAPRVVNNTFVGNDSSDGGALFVDGTGLTFTNNIVAYTAAGDGVSSDTATSARTNALTYNDWHRNASASLGGGLTTTTLGATNLTNPPDLKVWSADRDCTNDDFAPVTGSAVIDAGDPTLADPDDTTSDIGAYGGDGVDDALFVDGDGDGVLAVYDCDDADASVSTGTTWYADLDADGFGDAATTWTACEQPSSYVSDTSDCDDTDALVNPDATEVCDGVDNDCNGLTDASDPDTVGVSTWYADGDGDGFGDAGSTELSCDQPSGFVADATDCDDADARISPTADEVCDGVDNDCDGDIDLDAIDGTTWFADDDGDGFGDPTASRVACTRPTGFVADATDCDDTDPLTSPRGIEVCDASDNDCDGTVDLGAVDAATWFADDDGDGWGDSSVSLQACDQPEGHVDRADDCDDADARFYPFAPESCDEAVDYNCDGSVGDTDLDADGYRACEDCDDGDDTINPAGTESCDGADNDCDGTVDEADAVDASLWYADADADGYGDLAASVAACDQPDGYVALGTDCDDDDARFHPFAQEDCADLRDFNCDGSVGDADADADGFVACEDCHDGDPAVNPDATEICDDLDNDCDGLFDGDDDSLVGSEWHVDADGDGFGSDTAVVVDCEQPRGTLADGGDCDDLDESVNPDAEEVWYDGVDQDCDGAGDYDQDGDGFDALIAGGEDCDDLDETIHPDALDVPSDDVDQDCSGSDAALPDDDITLERGGCGCTTSSSSPAGLVAVLLGLVAVTRRRRQRNG